MGIAGGWSHSLGVKSDGTVVAWGRNDSGQCNVPAPNADFVTVAAGASHSLGLKSDGTIVAWGSNSHGECIVPPPNTGFVAVAGAGDHSLALRSSPPSALYDPMSGGMSNPDMLRILSVAPNPFATSADIIFEARESGPVSVTVHDVGGRHVTTAVLGSLATGRHRVAWDAHDAAGVRVASGVYFLRLRGVAGESRAVRVLLVP